MPAVTDRIYSIIVMAKDGPKLNKRILIPEYNKTRYKSTLQINNDTHISDIYRDFVIYTIQHSHSLDILCRNRATNHEILDKDSQNTVN
jgi:hypothetical protein